MIRPTEPKEKGTYGPLNDRFEFRNYRFGDSTRCGSRIFCGALLFCPPAASPDPRLRSDRHRACIAGGLSLSKDILGTANISQLVIINYLFPSSFLARTFYSIVASL